MTTPRPNLRLIADRTGLSVTTVSRALKDGPEVHPDTIARVKAAAQAVGYRPNLLGRGLRTGRSQFISLVMPLETEAHLADLAKVPLIEGMTIAAQQAGYRLAVHSTLPQADPVDALDMLIQSGGSDAVIITRMLPDDRRPALLQYHGIPFACFGRRGSGDTHPLVDIDNHWMAHEATSRMIAKGHRRIALQLLSRHDQSSQMRAAGYARALAEAGLDRDASLTGQDIFTIQAAETFFSALLAGADAPTALICANELGLMGALGALRRHGLQPGRDVMLAARDSTGISHYLSAPVLVHQIDMSQIGVLLIQSVLSALAAPDQPAQQTVVKGQFVSVG